MRVIVSAEVLVAMTPSENEEREFVAVGKTGRISIIRICFREIFVTSAPWILTINIEFSSITLVHELRCQYPADILLLKKSLRGVLSSSVRKYVTVSPELSWFYFRKIYFSGWNQWHDLLIGVIRNNVEGDVGYVGLEINSGLSRSIRALFTLHRGPAGLRKVLPCLFHRTSTRAFGLNAFTTWPIRRQSITISLFSLCPFPLLFLLRSHL